MFEKFTDRARRVVVFAQEEARALNHNYIGTEHILLGLLHEGEGVADKALESMGISLEAVRTRVEEIIGTGQVEPTVHIPFTPRAKKVLQLSLREALQLGHNYIGTEHILLGLIREGEGVAAQVLVALGAELDQVRQRVAQLLSGPAELVALGEMTAEVKMIEQRLAGGPSFAFTRADPATYPLCPGCNKPLEGALKYRVLDAGEEGGPGFQHVIVFYCERCGTPVHGTALEEGP